MSLVAYPAIRAKMGDWDYYVTAMRMDEIATRVGYAQKLFPASIMDELIQRALTDRRKSISEYLINQKQHFFGSIIIAVTGGSPKFTNVKVLDPLLDYANINGLGLLTFDGNQKYFALDGQHRLSAIQLAIENKPELANEQISVIIVQHNSTDEGRKRTRRLFTTLNRYAKAISKQDVVAMDEDDASAIITRRLVDENYPLFLPDRLVLSMSKSLKASNDKVFTNAITIYDVNDFVLKANGYPINKKFKQLRPSDEMLEKMYKEVIRFWNNLCFSIKPIGEMAKSIKKPISSKYRSSNGGHYLFRPLGLSVFAQVYERGLKQKINEKTLWKRLSKVNYDLNSLPWRGIVWHPSENKMLYEKGRGKLSMELLSYIVGVKVDEVKILKNYRDALEDDTALLPARIKW